MSVTLTLKDFLTRELDRNFDTVNVIAPWANREFEGQIKKQGDTVTVQDLPTLTWSKKKTAGADISDSGFTVGSQNFQITEVAQILIAMKDLDSIRYNRKLQADIALRISESRSRLTDQFIARFARDANSSNKENNTTPVTLSTSNVLSEIEKLNVNLGEQNVSMDSKIPLFLSPSAVSILRQGDFLNSTEKGVGIRTKGFIANISGFAIHQTNNLQWVQDLNVATQVTATDTVTIQGVVFTFVASPSSAGDVDVGGDVDTSVANLVAAINGGTGAGSAYIAVSTANRAILDDAGIFAVADATNDRASIYADDTITNSETLTDGTDGFGDAADLAFATQRGAINFAQQLTEFDIRKEPKGFTKNVLGELVYDGKVFTNAAKAITSSRIKRV